MPWCPPCLVPPRTNPGPCPAFKAPPGPLPMTCSFPSRPSQKGPLGLGASQRASLSRRTDTNRTERMK